MDLTSTLAVFKVPPSATVWPACAAWVTIKLSIVRSAMDGLQAGGVETVTPSFFAGCVSVFVLSVDSRTDLSSCTLPETQDVNSRTCGTPLS